MKKTILILTFCIVYAVQGLDKLHPIIEFIAERKTMSAVRKILIAPNGDLMIGMGRRDLNFWSISKGELLRRDIVIPERMGGGLIDMALNESGTILAYIINGKRKQAVFLDIVSGQRINIMTGNRGDWLWTLDRHPSKIAISGPPDKIKRVAVRYHDGYVQLINVADDGSLNLWIERLGTSLEDTIAFGNGGNFLWATSKGWGWRQNSSEQESFSFHPSSSFFPLDITPHGFFYIQDDCTYKLLRVSERDNTTLDSIVTLRPSLFKRFINRARDAGCFPNAPKFAFFHTFAGVLEVHPGGSSKIRDFSGNTLKKFRAVIEMKNVPEELINYYNPIIGIRQSIDGSSHDERILFAIARGSIVSVYEIHRISF